LFSITCKYQIKNIIVFSSIRFRAELDTHLSSQVSITNCLSGVTPLDFATIGGNAKIRGIFWQIFHETQKCQKPSPVTLVDMFKEKQNKRNIEDIYSNDQYKNFDDLANTNLQYTTEPLTTVFQVNDEENPIKKIKYESPQQKEKDNEV